MHWRRIWIKVSEVWRVLNRKHAGFSPLKNQSPRIDIEISGLRHHLQIICGRFLQALSIGFGSDLQRYSPPKYPTQKFGEKSKFGLWAVGLTYKNTIV